MIIIYSSNQKSLFIRLTLPVALCFCFVVIATLLFDTLHAVSYDIWFSPLKWAPAVFLHEQNMSNSITCKRNWMQESSSPTLAGAALHRSPGNPLWKLSWVAALWQQARFMDWTITQVKSNDHEWISTTVLHFLALWFISVYGNLILSFSNNNFVEIVVQKMKCHRAPQDVTQPGEEEVAFGWCIKIHPAVHRMWVAHTHHHKIYMQ